MNQPHGDPQTEFVLYGRGWPPGTPVTIPWLGVGVAADKPVTDRAGSFNHVVNQGREFFPGTLPVGTHVLEVTGAGHQFRTEFRVDP